MRFRTRDFYWPVTGAFAHRQTAAVAVLPAAAERPSHLVTSRLTGYRVQQVQRLPRLRDDDDTMIPSQKKRRHDSVLHVVNRASSPPTGCPGCPSTRPRNRRSSPVSTRTLRPPSHAVAVMAAPAPAPTKVRSCEVVWSLRTRSGFHLSVLCSALRRCQTADTPALTLPPPDAFGVRGMEQALVPGPAIVREAHEPCEELPCNVGERVQPHFPRRICVDAHPCLSKGPRLCAFP